MTTAAALDDLVHWLVRSHGQELLPGTRVRVGFPPAVGRRLWADGKTGTVRQLSDLTDFGTVHEPRVDVWYEVDVDDAAPDSWGTVHPQTFGYDELQPL